MEKHAGFTLIELLIAITILGVLTAIALPSYQGYTRRAHYTELVQAVAPYKLGVEACYQTMGGLDACKAGQNGVPPNMAGGEGAGLVDSITVEDDDSIVVVPRARYGIQPADTYVLAPTDHNGGLTWAATGGGVAKGYAN